MSSAIPHPAPEEVCARHGVTGLVVSRLAGGSVPVYAIGSDLVLKFYPPGEEAFAATEVAVLSALAGRLPVPTPRLHASGSHDGWSYVLMGRLRGTLLVDAWPGLTVEDRQRVVEQLGQCMAALHAVDVAGTAALASDWPSFVMRQRAACVERQREAGLGEPLLSQIEDFLAETALPDTAPVLLHTEIMREHLMIEPGPRGPVLSGLFDFEPAMVGAAGYELASVGLFVTCGDARLLRRLLAAYGIDESLMNVDLQRRCMAWALLHRYSNLPWYLRRLPPPAGATTLEALARHWWAL